MPSNRRVVEKNADLINFVTRISPLKKGELGNRWEGYFLYLFIKMILNSLLCFIYV